MVTPYGGTYPPKPPHPQNPLTSKNPLTPQKTLTFYPLKPCPLIPLNPTYAQKKTLTPNLLQKSLYPLTILLLPPSSPYILIFNPPQTP